MKSDPDDFETAARSPRTTLGREILGLLRQNRKWWLVPILIALLALGVFIAVAVISPGAAPFIYTLF